MLSLSKHLTLRQAQGERDLVRASYIPNLTNTAHAEPVEARQAQGERGIYNWPLNA